MFPIVTLFVSYCGLIICSFAAAQDCSKKEAAEVLFVNTNDNITFNINNVVILSKFTMYRNNELVCTLYLGRNLNYKSCMKTEYENRISVHPVHRNNNHTDWYITIFGAKRSDNGTYFFENPYQESYDFHMCFTVFVYGPPTSEITVTPRVIEAGNKCLLHCSANSTTVPDSHNLTIHISWYIDGQAVKTGDRFRVNNESLIIYPVTKDDVNHIITCEAREDGGPTTLTNTTLSVHWGPAPGPELQPPNTVYLLEPGKQLPTINCIADCHRQCELRWIKLSSHSVLSNNGVLSVGRLGSDSAGEYMCVAIRMWDSTKTSNVSIIVVILKHSAETPVTTIAPEITQKYMSVLQETQQNYTPVAIVGAVLGTALLLAIILIVYLLRRRNSSATDHQISAASQPEVPVELATQNANYEELRQDTSTNQTYDALTADVMNTGRDNGSRNEMEQTSVEYIDVLPPNDCYENAAIKTWK